MTDERRNLLRGAATVAIGLIAAAITLVATITPGLSVVMRQADWVFYDTFYKFRPIEKQDDGPVVIVAVDDASLADVDVQYKLGWPWSRDGWPVIAEYLRNAGAKAMVLDVLLSESSARGEQDDDGFAAGIDALHGFPMAFARVAESDGSWGRFRPPTTQPVEFGATDVTSEKVFRDFYPTRYGRPTLALAALRAAGIEPKLATDRPFLLHYYGPHRDGSNKPTFPTWKASAVLMAGNGEDKARVGISPEMFRDKIVIVGVMADALHDIKAAPHDAKFPGVEIQATAIANLIRGQAVQPISTVAIALLAIMTSMAAAGGAIIPRRTWAKLLPAILIAAAIVFLSIRLFRGDTIRWLSPTVPLVSILLAAIGGISYAYFREDRRARELLKALEACLSPHIAAQLERNPRRLATGGKQLEMTVMFTDLAGFTTLTEKLREKIEPVLNYYLGEMSGEVLRFDGTLDKFIGDAIMTFWNAPIDQYEHARYACEAALAIQQREREIRPKLAEMGVTEVITRIGINTGPMVVGFMGSSRKLNYTVIGDSVNLAARLEPANKLYNTQILVAEPTVQKCREHFLFRMVDLLQVKGKTEPMRVYELMGHAAARAEPMGELADKFEKAFELHRKKRWDDAQAILLELGRRFPDDGPTQTLLERIAGYRESPPAEDWDGVYVATSK